MKVFSKVKLPDIAVNALAFLLAGSCSYFAGYMILRLQHMENPPADMGLNFPPSKKKIITDEPVLVDPLATNAIDFSTSESKSRVVQPYTRDSPVLDRLLLTVIDGIAFVEVVRVTGKEIVALSVGSELPGAGQVRRIERTNGRWRLVADDAALLSGRR